MRNGACSWRPGHKRRLFEGAGDNPNPNLSAMAARAPSLTAASGAGDCREGTPGLPPSSWHCCSVCPQDLVKTHLMFAVREEVEVLREQIKELSERNVLLEQENALLRSLASAEQLTRFQAQLPTARPPPSGTV